jgi:dolichol-phosphate mannosyltransferase
MRLSIVSPVYRAETILPKLVSRIEAAVTPITSDYEIVLVDDYSPDGSWRVMEQIAKTNKRVKAVKLSRNFGQHYAITAGLDHANGDWIVVMDCDLQDQPEEIAKLYAKALEGYDVVLARRYERKDTFLKRFFSASFYRTLGYLTGSKMDESVANFGIYSRNAINAVISMRESIRYFPTMIKWVGFPTAKVDVEHDERQDGKSSYNLKRLFNLALDIILAYSDKPIRLVVKLGIYISLSAVFIAVYYLIKYLSGGVLVPGFASLIISVWLLSGIIISTLGVVGLYVGKTFEGVKKRPIYVVEKIIND